MSAYYFVLISLTNFQYTLFWVKRHLDKFTGSAELWFFTICILNHTEKTFFHLDDV